VRPSAKGIITSMTTASGGADVIAVRAAAPSFTVVTR